MNTHIVKLNITLPKYFLEIVDKAAQNQGLSRSSFIRLALMQKMEMKHLFDTDAERQQKAKQTAFWSEINRLAYEEEDEIDDNSLNLWDDDIK